MLSRKPPRDGCSRRYADATWNSQKRHSAVFTGLRHCPPFCAEYANSVSKRKACFGEARQDHTMCTQRLPMLHLF